ncbi:hypothetical protein AB0K40_32695 [Nonomuraea bangladeshensis]|uniref:NUDIX hydrolase n=1 Tax=Nonomuraea bangladeshensis TaxID=404385 RepID=A0ABV3HCQ1_9ACTN
MKALSVLAVTAVVRRDAEVLLVRQRNAGDPAAVWDLPDGNEVRRRGRGVTILTWTMRPRTG